MKKSLKAILEGFAKDIEQFEKEYRDLVSESLEGESGALKIECNLESEILEKISIESKPGDGSRSSKNLSVKFGKLDAMLFLKPKK